MDKNKGVKIPVQLRVNMWLGLSAHEKKFNSFSEGTFSVFAEMVLLLFTWVLWQCFVLVGILPGLYYADKIYFPSPPLSRSPFSPSV
jgi:hypothetical protein